MFWVYIIFSKSLNRYYTGESHDLTERLLLHNQHIFSKAHTTKASDWKFQWCLPCISRKQARSIEAFIKKMKSRKFLKRLIVSDPAWLYQKFPH